VPQGKGAFGGVSMRGNPTLINALNQSLVDKFDMTELVGTLNEKANQEKRKKKPKPANPDGFSSIIHTANVSNKFLASNYDDMEKTVTDKTMKKGLHEKGKFSKNLPPKSSVASASDISLEDEDEFERTMKADEARAALPPPPDPLQMMNLVVRTLTQVFPKVTQQQTSYSGPKVTQQQTSYSGPKVTQQQTSCSGQIQVKLIPR
jgi:hypothetical protein